MSDIRLKVDLILAQVQLIKLKADEYTFYAHTSKETQELVNATLAEITEELEQL